jgi:hypothetical protein
MYYFPIRVLLQNAEPQYTTRITIINDCLLPSSESFKHLLETIHIFWTIFSLNVPICSILQNFEEKH